MFQGRLHLLIFTVWIRAEQKNITRPKTDKTETVSGDADRLGRTSGLQMTNFSYE